MNAISALGSYEALASRVNPLVDGAFEQVNVLPPRGLSSELDFVRLVNWSYAVFFEAARVASAFLAELPERFPLSELKAQIGNIRTLLNHNLSIDSASDRRKLEACKRWFRGACGKDFPDSGSDYEKCCALLSTSVEAALQRLILASQYLSDPTDGPGLVEDLRSRIALHWPAHKFDELARRIALEVGVAEIDVRGLRERRLDAWRRSLLSGPAGREVDSLVLTIQADLLEIAEGRLSVSAATVLRSIELETRDSLIAALLIIRSAERRGVRGVEEILIEVGRMPR